MDFLFYAFYNQLRIILCNSIEHFHRWCIILALIPQSVPHSHYATSESFQIKDTRSQVVGSIVVNRMWVQKENMTCTLSFYLFCGQGTNTFIGCVEDC